MVKNLLALATEVTEEPPKRERTESMASPSSTGTAPAKTRPRSNSTSAKMSSFAKGMRQSGLCREVIGCDLDPVSRRQAVPLGVVVGVVG